MRAMTEDEWRRFLLDAPRTAKLATVRKDGRPHVAPIWFALDGTATVDEDAAQLRIWAARIGGRYMGQDRAEAYGERNGVPGELLVRVTIANVVAMDGVAE